MKKRRGLAPLEMVLSLPILLFVMALIVNFGVLACWKVRAATVSRQAVWRQRYAHTGATDPRPAGWPAWTSPPSVGGGADLFSDPFAQHVVVRGPSVGNGGGGGIALTVNQDRLDFAGGVTTGNAQIQVTMPLLPNLPRVRFDLRAPLLSRQWQFGEMGLPQNVWRRTPHLYEELTLPCALVPGERAAYMASANAILTAPFRGDLSPLDRDQEFFDWYSQHPQPDPDYRPPDFHPRVVRDLGSGARCTLPGRYPPPPQPMCFPACELDAGVVQVSYVEAHLLPDIANVPENMKRRFIRLYQDQINYLQTQIPAMPPTPPALTAQIQALQNIIDNQLQPFVTR